MAEWHALFEEDAYSRGFIFLQRGDDEDTREMFDTFAGIAPGSVPGFVLSQLAGAALAVLLNRMLLGAAETARSGD